MFWNLTQDHFPKTLDFALKSCYIFAYLELIHLSNYVLESYTRSLCMPKSYLVVFHRAEFPSQSDDFSCISLVVKRALSLVILTIGLKSVIKVISFSTGCCDCFNLNEF